MSSSVAATVLPRRVSPGGAKPFSRNRSLARQDAAIASIIDDLPQFVYPEGSRVGSHALQPDEPDVEPSDSDVEEDSAHDDSKGSAGAAGNPASHRSGAGAGRLPIVRGLRRGDAVRKRERRRWRRRPRLAVA